MSKLALQNRVPRQYDQASLQEIVRQLEQLVNRHEDRLATLGTEVASTSGTSIDFTGIPSWVTRIEVNFVGVSTNGASNWLIQVGDSGGIETTGYLGSGSAGTPANFTTGYGLPFGGAANTGHGTVVLTLQDAAQFTWVASGNVALSDAAAVAVTAGSKSLSAALDRVRITTVNGTDAFDAGAINIRMS